MLPHKTARSRKLEPPSACREAAPSQSSCLPPPSPQADAGGRPRPPSRPAGGPPHRARAEAREGSGPRAVPGEHRLRTAEDPIRVVDRGPPGRVGGEVEAAPGRLRTSRRPRRRIGALRDSPVPAAYSTANRRRRPAGSDTASRTPRPPPCATTADPASINAVSGSPSHCGGTPRARDLADRRKKSTFAVRR